MHTKNHNTTIARHQLECLQAKQKHTTKGQVTGPLYVVRNTLREALPEQDKYRGGHLQLTIELRMGTSLEE